MYNLMILYNFFGNINSMERSQTVESLKRTFTLSSLKEIPFLGSADGKSIEAGYASKKYFQRIEIMEWAFVIFMMLQLLLLHFYFELDIQGSSYAFTFQYSAFAVGILLILTQILKHFSREQYNCVRKKTQQNKSGLYINICLLLVMPYPFLEGVLLNLQTVTLESYQETEYSLKLNYLLIMLTIFRSGFFGMSLLIKSRYMSPRAQRICTMYGAQPGTIFCLRCVFKDSPFAFMTTLFVISVAVFSFLFRIAEYQIYSVSSVTMYGNMAWMTVITMTSVGYGDFTPKTPFGRLIVALCVSWGVLILSVMVVVLTNAFSMNRNQSQSLNILNKLQKNSVLREKAAEYLRESLWRVWKNYKSSQSTPSRLQQRKKMQVFRQCRRERQMEAISQSEIDFYNEMIRQFERAFVNMGNLTTNNLKIIDYLNQEYIFNEGSMSESGLMLFKK